MIAVGSLTATPLKAPFPYFGGKRAIAPRVWEWLGDVGGYVEPFAGSAAVLLARPQFTGRRVETLNDIDGYVVNAWRAIKHDPEAVAYHCSDPVSEIDKVARAAWLVARGDEFTTRLMGDPEYFDAKVAGWWVYVLSASIGNPVDGSGSWVQVRDADGVMRLVKRDVATNKRGVNREMPHLSTAGQGVKREMPHLANAGKGIKRGQNTIAYLQSLADRLTGVRITCGDYKRVLNPSVVETTAGNSHVGILFDPPYETGHTVYAHHDRDISAEVREWCKTANPDYRIVLCGYDNDHDELLAHGWTKHVGKATGGGGYKKTLGEGASTSRERVWTSPACLSDHGLLEGLI